MVFGQEKQQQAFKKIVFNSEDGLEITADLYLKNDESTPFIVLCHQAGGSRGEYQEIQELYGKNSMITRRTGRP